MKFKGKIGVIMWTTFALVTFMLVGLCTILDYSNPGEFIPIIIMSAAIIGFVLWFLVRNYYVLTEDTIKICLGPTTSNLKINSICSVKKVISFIASGAGSAVRLEIVYYKGSVTEKAYISPQREDEFIAKLCEYNKYIKVLEPAR